MENEKSRTTTIAVVTGIVALLLGLCLGMMLGGVGGYFIGRSAAPAPKAVLLPTSTPVPPRLATPERRLPATPTPERRGPMGPGGIIGGALVQEVLAGTPAEGAGLRVGDIITRVDDTPIDANHRLADVLAGYKPGDQVKLTIWRGAQTRTLTVNLGPHPDQAQRAYLGIRYSELGMPVPTPQP